LEELSESIPWLSSKGFDYTKYPLGNLAKDAVSPDDQTFSSAVRMITAIASHKRDDALILLYGLFEYYKNDIRRLETIAESLTAIENVQFVEFLFKQIQNIQNTTRIYLNTLIKKLRYFKPDLVLEGFEKLLENKDFSYRMKSKFKEIINELKERKFSNNWN
jgi:hypothetical protein